MTCPIRLIAIDIDGTLLNSKVELSDENRDALRRANEAGVEIVLGTGRRHDFALPIAESLGFELWMIQLERRRHTLDAVARRFTATYCRKRRPSNWRKRCENIATTWY